MKTVKLYTPAELKKKNPEGFESALQHFRDGNNDIPWTDEIMDSLKALFKATNGVYLRDWSIDAYGYSYVRVEFNQDEAGDLTGNRALAWLENNLLGDLRVNRSFLSRVKQYSGKWYDFTKYGEIPSCPLTGVCFDEDYIESLLKSIKAGDTLKEAFENLADVASKLFQAEIEGQDSEENFLEQNLYFTKDGTPVYA